MTQADLHLPVATPDHLQFPALQAEDYLPILRGLSVIAWIALAGMIGLELWTRLNPALSWPHMGGFSLAYHLITAEFATATLTFSLMITHRSWFEQAPRAASAKLNYVLWIMLIWLGLHYFGMLHLTGGVNSPLLLLLPSILIAAYLSLPSQIAARMAGSLIGALILLVTLEQTATISPEGALAAALHADGHSLQPILIALLLALLLAIVLGRGVHARFHAHNLALHRGPLCDPLTRLFTRATLERRLATELVRANHQKTPTSVLLIEIGNLEQIIAEQGFEASARLLQELAAAVSRSLRAMDTPARYGAKTLAALLPTLSQEVAQTVAQRVYQASKAITSDPSGTDAQVTLGMAVTDTPERTSGAQLLAAAESALATAAALPPGTAPVEIV